MTEKTLTEDEIRSDERRRVAALLIANKETLAEFASDKVAVVGLVALMLEQS